MAGIADQKPLHICHQSFLQDLRLPQDTQRLVPDTKSKVAAAVAFADPQEARLLLHKSSFPHEGQHKPLKLQQLSKLYIDNSSGDHHATAGAKQILRNRSCKPVIVSQSAPRHNGSTADEDGKHRSTSARNFDPYTKTPGDALQNGGQQVAKKANQGSAVHSKKNDFTLRSDSVMVVTNCSATSAACRICGRVFLSARALGGHMRTHVASQFIYSVADLQDMREQQNMQQTTSSNHRQDGTEEEVQEFCRLGYDDEAITVDLTKGADHGKQLQRRRSSHFQIHCTGIEDQCVEDKLPRLDNDQDDTAQLMAIPPLATGPHDGDGDVEDEADLMSPFSGASASEQECRRAALSCSGGDGGDDQLKLMTAPDLDIISDGHPSPIKSFEGGPNMIERSRSYELRRNPKPNRRFVKDEQQLGRAPASANSSDSVSPGAKGYARSAATTSSRATVVVSSSEKRRSSVPPSSTAVVSELPSSAHSCTECGKLFFSWKALFGHMRCHPERQWRGIQPPSVVGHRQSSDSTVTTNQSTFDRHVLQGGVAIDAKMHRSRFKKKRPSESAADSGAPNHASSAIVDDKTSVQVSTAADGTGGFTIRAKESIRLIGDGERRMKPSADHNLHDRRFQQREIRESAVAAAVTAEKIAKCRSVDDRHPSGPPIKKHVGALADRAMAEDVDHSYDTVINGSSRPDQVLSDEFLRKKRSRGSDRQVPVTRTDDNRDQSSSSYVSLISDDGAVVANMNSSAGLGRGVQKGTAIWSCTVADIPVVDMAMAKELFPGGAAEIRMDQYLCLSPWRNWRTRSKRSKRRRVGNGFSEYHHQPSLRRPADQAPPIPTIPSVEYPSAPSKIKPTASSSHKDACCHHSRLTQDHKLPVARDDSHEEDIDLDVANCLVFLSAGSGDPDVSRSPPQKSSSTMAETDGSTQGLAATDRWRTRGSIDATKRSSKNQCNSTGEKCVDSHQTVRGHKANHCKQQKAAQARMPTNADPSRRIAIAILSNELSNGRDATIRSSDQLVSAPENEAVSSLRYKHETASAATDYSLRSALRHAQQRVAMNRACTSSSKLEQQQRQMESKLQMQKKSYNHSSDNDLQQSDVRFFRRFSVLDSDHHNQKSIGSGYSLSTTTTAEAAASTLGRVHECSICHRLFPSGQALGGHKRCHWTGAGGDKLTAADSSTIDAGAAGDSAVNYASSSVTSSNIGGNISCNDMIKQLSACSNYSDDAQQVDQRSVDGMIGSASANILQVDLDVNRLNYSSTSLSSSSSRLASRRSVEMVGNRNDEGGFEEDIEAPPSTLRLFDLNLPAPVEMELQMDIS